MQKKHYLLTLLFLSCLQFINAQNIIITEISYNPPSSGSDSLEFIEIYNHDIIPVNLNNWTFTSGVVYTFDDVTMAVGEHLVIATNSGAIENVFGYANAYQWAAGGLSNGGEPIALKDSSGNLIDSLRYDDTLPWPATDNPIDNPFDNPDGGGPTIVLCDYDADNTNAANWVACNATGTTGKFENEKEVFGTPGTGGGCEPSCNSSSTDTQVACNSYTWMDGNIYTSSNTTATYTLINAEGCDSVIGLDLTINATSSTDNQVICEPSYTWIDGNTYSSSNNTATLTLTNSAGCDSVITLNLNLTNTITEIAQSEIANINTCSTSSESFDRIASTDYVSYGEFVKADGDWVEINEVAPEIAGTNRTVSAWIKHPNQVSGSAQVIVGMNTSGTSTVSNFLIGTNEKVGVYDGGNYRYTTSIITDGEWHHVAYTYNEASNSTNIYIDGVVEKTYTNGQTIATNGRVSIGQEYDGSSTGNYFDGFITEVSIWNEELSAGEIQLLMDAAISSNHPKYSNLKGYYTMNTVKDGCSTDLTYVKDNSGNELHGVASNEILSISAYEQISEFNSAAHFDKSWVYNNAEIATTDTLTLSSSAGGDYELLLSRDHINITNSFSLIDGDCLDFNWAQKLEGSDLISPQGVCNDSRGYTYVTGYYEGAMDLDPGAGSQFDVNLSDYPSSFIQKLNIDGSLVWAKAIVSNNDAGESYTNGLDITNDEDGNVYVTGKLYGTIDMDPGPGTYNLSSGTNSFDGFILKLDTDGNFLWATNVCSSGGSFTSTDIQLNSIGEIYITGGIQTSNAVIPTQGGNTTLIAPPSGSGYPSRVIVKYDTMGNALWAKGIEGETGWNLTQGKMMTIDTNDDIIFTGRFSSTIDLDPGVGVDEATTPAASAYIIKLNTNGDYVWGKTFDTDSSGNWTQSRSISSDKNNNILLNIRLVGTVDVDPGAGTFSLTPSNAGSLVVLKMNSSGEFVWAKLFDDGIFKPQIGTDADLNLYIAGEFVNTIDVDPGAGATALTSFDSDFDAFIVKLDTNGDYLSHVQISKTEENTLGIINTLQDISVSKWGSVQLINNHWNTSTDFDFSGDGYELTSYIHSGFIAQYGDLMPTNDSFTYYATENGSGLQNGYSEANALANASTLNSVLKSGDSLYLLDGVINESSDIQIPTGSTLYITDGATLNTGNHKLTNNGTIEISKDAALLQSTGGILDGSGNFKIDRFAGNNTALFNFMSSPVDAVDVRTVFGGSNCVAFDPAEQSNGLNGWSYILTENLINGHGYAVNGSNAEDADGTRTFVGTANNGNIDAALNGQTYGAGYDGWNLLGNPYPSALDMKNFIDNNSDVGAVTFYDQSAEMYVTYNTLNADGLHIASGQGFFVEFSTANSGTAHFTNSMRHESAATIEKNAAIAKAMLEISDNNGEAYTTYIAFMADASDGFDMDYDAKLIPDANELSIYSMLHSDDYSIQGFAPIQDSKTIRLGMDGLGGKTSIALTALENFDANVSITLIDHKEQIEHDFRQGAYAFTAEEGTNNSRFEIRFERQANPVEQSIKPEINVMYSDKQISITSDEILDVQNIVLYDITGKYIAEYRNNSTNNNRTYVTIGTHANAIYLLEIQTDKGVYHQKVYLK